MISKIKLMLQLLLFSFFCFSCSKHDDSPAPVAPVLLDTLGVGWQRVKIDTTINFEDIFFVNNQIGFLCGDRYIGKSTDGGLTWNRIISDSLNQYFANLFFLDANNGWATGDNFLLRTNNGGATWTKVHAGPTFDVQFFDVNNGYITTNQQGIFKTADGGITFSPIPNMQNTRALFFQDINKGWIINSFNSPLVYKTEDGGSSFEKRAGIGQNVYAMQFVDDLHGWMGGQGSIFRTTDGGVTLEQIAMSASPGGDISFFDSNNGFVLAHNSIYSTADGGKTLTKLCQVNKANLIEFHFTDLSHGWATGGGGYVYRYVKP